MKELLEGNCIPIFGEKKNSKLIPSFFEIYSKNNKENSKKSDKKTKISEICFNQL